MKIFLNSRFSFNFSILLFLFILGLTNIFSAGYYQNNGDYLYFSNNSISNISVNISTDFESVLVSRAILDISGNIFEKSYNDYILKPGDSKTFSLNFTQKILPTDNVFFKLYAYGPDGLEINPIGEPTIFKINIDEIKPTLITQLSNSYSISGSENLNLNLLFDELIYSYKVFNNGILTKDFVSPSNLQNDLRDNFDFSFSSNNLNEGNNLIKIEFSDFAGNKDFVEFNIISIGLPLRVELITRIEDNTANYYFDKDFPLFFNKTIYSSSENFDLKIRTSKKADCVLGYNLNSFIGVDSFSNSNKKIFLSEDSINHYVRVSTPNQIVIACKNKFYQTEVVYLNDVLGISNDLIKLKKDSGITLNLDKVFPTSTQITTNKLSILANTNKRSLCDYSLDSSSKTFLNSNDFIKHFDSNITIIDGRHDLNFFCIDQAGIKSSKKSIFSIDSSKGVKLSNINPKYLSKTNPVNVEFSISDSNAICKYSKEEFIVGGDLTFSSLTNEVLGDGFLKNFPTGTLTDGDNNFYITCLVNGNINSNLINIIVDSKGPSLSNLTFYNLGKKSIYLSNQNSLSLKFNVESKIPISKYFIEFVRRNNSEFREFNSNEVSFIINLKNTSKIKIIGQNELGFNSSPIEKNLIFDLNPPKLEVKILGKKFRLICEDKETGCLKILYGFSNSKNSCLSNIEFNKNDSISFLGNKYLCAKGFDKVQNFVEIIKPLIAGFNSSIQIINDSNTGDSSQVLDKQNLTNSNLNSNSNNLNNNSNSGDSNPDFFNNLNNNDDNSNSNNTLLISIITLMIILVIIGGGYFAYKKGYLNSTLNKIGLSKYMNNTINNNPNNPNNNNNNLNENSINDRQKNIFKDNSQIKNNFGNSNNLNNNNSNSKTSKSYDEHLNKLNNFIDKKINGGNKVFNKFEDSSHINKVVGYEDTLIKKTSSKKKNSKSKSNSIDDSDFDEFYSSSKKVKTSNYNSLEKESEAFESFSKNKSKGSNKANDGKNNKNKK